MISWLEKNKLFVIYYLATVSMIFILYLLQKVIIDINEQKLLNSLNYGETTGLMIIIAGMNIIYKIMLGLSFVLTLILVIKIVFSIIRKII